MGSRKLSPTEKFWSLVQKTESCWLWIGNRQKQGYGMFRSDGDRQRAHRLAWALVNGPIPDGLWVLHHCDNPPCVNPAHLFLGTAADNVDDMVAKGRNRSLSGKDNPQGRKTHCPKGHAYDEANTRVQANRRWHQRVCRACMREAMKQFRARARLEKAQRL